MYEAVGKRTGVVIIISCIQVGCKTHGWFIIMPQAMLIAVSHNIIWALWYGMQGI